MKNGKMTLKEFKARFVKGLEVFHVRSAVRGEVNQTYAVEKVQSNGVWLKSEVPPPNGQLYWLAFPKAANLTADEKGFVIRFADPPDPQTHESEYRWSDRTQAAKDEASNRLKILDDLRGLASGTLAALSGRADNPILDRLQAELVGFAQGNWNGAWECWQSVWEAFVAKNPEWDKANAPAVTPHPEVVVALSKWARIKAGERVVCDGQDLDRLQEYFRDEQSEDYRLLDRLASEPNPERVGVHGEYIAWLKTDTECNQAEVDRLKALAADVTANPTGNALVDRALRIGLERAAEAIEEQNQAAKEAMADAAIKEGIAEMEKDAQQSAAEEEVQPKPEPELLLVPAGLAGLAKVAAQAEQARFGATTGIRLERRPGGYRAEATDGRILVRVDGTHPLNAETYPRVDGLPDNNPDARQAIVPGKVWAAACKAVPNGKKVKHKPLLGHLAVAMTGKGAVLASTDLSGSEVKVVDSLEGRYPDATKVFLSEGKIGRRVRLGINNLLRLVQAAQGVLGSSDELTFELPKDPKGVVQLRGTNAESGAELVGLIVPLVERG